MNEAELKEWKLRRANDAAANRDLLMKEEKDFNVMTPERESHLSEIMAGVKARLDSKYRKGQIEHGGNVWDRNPVKEMDGEIIDQIVYHAVLVKRDERICQAVTLARHSLQVNDLPLVEKCLDAIFTLTHQPK
jgi:hypothetical protein